jgi:hypothetical protein
LSIKFESKGNLGSLEGLKISMIVENCEVGFAYLVNFRKSFDIDYNIVKLYDDYEKTCFTSYDIDFFNSDNSLFLHSFNIFENNRFKGFGKSLLNKSIEISIVNNYEFLLLLSDNNNLIANLLYKKNNFKTHLKNKEKILYYKRFHFI